MSVRNTPDQWSVPVSYTHLDVYKRQIQSWTTKILKDNSALAESINELFNKYFVKAEHWLTNDMLPQLNSLIKNFSLGLIGVVAFLKNLVLGFIISVYILYSKETLIGNAKRGCMRFFVRRLRIRLSRPV